MEFCLASHLDQLAGRGRRLAVELVDLFALPLRPAEAPGGHQLGGRAQLLDLSP